MFPRCQSRPPFCVTTLLSWIGSRRHATQQYQPPLRDWAILFESLGVARLPEPDATMLLAGSCLLCKNTGATVRDKYLIDCALASTCEGSQSLLDPVAVVPAEAPKQVSMQLY